MDTDPTDLVSAKLQVQLEQSLYRVGNKKLLAEMIETIKTPDFPRNTSKKFLISWLENLSDRL